ncbi:iron ABC transporter permease [Paenibacillus oralis]|uniref:Iron ABC transporter permease n=1 Tax=Paenibacillus oralis TaxID=2490856 RepID=A0A3P3U7G2_9BACL|nr:iron ABC transporter permease [Paenibacillus oralis]RRJ66180.1 iron ABC transporter permease [Paenibacillus oralis]
MNRLLVWRSKSGRVSLLLSRKTLLIWAGLTLLLLAAFVAGLTLGSKWISPAELLGLMRGKGSADSALTVCALRLPRLLLAVLVGAALASAGCILQGMIRNPLASPDMIGITGGASFAAVAFLTYFAGAVSIKWLPVAAMLGAGGISLLIYLLAWSKGVTATRLVLIGIGISAATGSFTTLMLVLSPIHAAGQAYIWMTGSIYGASWNDVLTILPWFAVFFPLALICSRHVTVQELGDDVAQGLGASVQRQRLVLLFICVALSGAAVAVAGAIGFIGLMAPHIAKKLVGPSLGGLLPVAAVIGALLLVVADSLARTVFLPLDIPAGVFTAGVGGPFFIYLLYRNRNR